MCILSFTEEGTPVKAEWRQKDRREGERQSEYRATEVFIEHATVVKAEYRNKRDRTAKTKPQTQNQDNPSQQG